MTPELPPVALTIAGSDCSGGAGVQMDLKVFCALGVYGASVLTAVTVQNSMGVRRVQGLSSKIVGDQLSAILDDLSPGAIKTGMLWSTQNVLAVAQQLSQLKKLPPLVIDPVMCAKDGSRLLSKRAVEALIHELLPLATIITPNLDEIRLLCGRPVTNPKEARQAAEKLIAMGAKSALVKGGHFKEEIVDIFFDGREQIELHAQQRAQGPIHGTGCALSAAIAANLAKGQTLQDALTHAYINTQKLIHMAGRLGKGYRLLFPEKTK